MACNIKENKVLDNNGNTSNLFKALERKYNRDQALEMFKASHSDEFINIYGNQEPSVGDLEEFLAYNNRTERTLTTEEIEDFRNSLIGFDGTSEDFKSVADRTLFENGIFEIKNSPIYNQFELENLKSDPELQNKVRETMQALQNTEIQIPNNDFSIDQIEYSSTFNSFGKLNKLNPNVLKQDILNEVAGVNKEEYDQIMETLPYDKQHISFEEAQQYVKAEILVDVNGIIQEPSLGDVLSQTVDVEKAQKLLNTINTLLNTSDEVLLSNADDTKNLLRYLERESAKTGIDIIGLRNEIENLAFKPFLASMGNMIIEPSQDNVATFASVHTEIFPNTVQKTRAIRRENNRDYVTLRTNQNEGDIYEQASLLKIDENLYIRVNDKPLEELYLISGISKEDNERQGSNIGASNRETAEKINLLKSIFNISEPTTPPVEIVEQVPFTGDFNYLTGDYISEFYSKLLQEKEKNSALYQNFYSAFEVNESGINIKYTDDYTMSIIDSLADENLRQYSLLSKQIPELSQQIEEYNPDFSQMERDFYVNNPEQAPLLSAVSTIIENDVIAVKNSNQNFIRLSDNSIWENTQSLQGFDVFVRLPSVNLDYNIFGTPRPFYENFSIIPQETKEVREKKNDKIKNEELFCQ